MTPREQAVWTLACMLWDANNTTRFTGYPAEVQEPILEAARKILYFAAFRPDHERQNLAQEILKCL